MKEAEENEVEFNQQQVEGMKMFHLFFFIYFKAHTLH